MDKVVKCYNPMPENAYQDIAANLEDWVKEAILIRWECGNIGVAHKFVDCLFQPTIRTGEPCSPLRGKARNTRKKTDQ